MTTVPSDSEFGKRLKYLRDRLRMTQREVAEAVTQRGLPLSVVWYSKLEREPDARPSEQMLDAILAVLGATRDELAGAEPALARDTWSDPVQAPASPLQERGRTPFLHAPAPAPRLTPLAELVTVWERLPPAERSRLLAFARSL